jgi:hypothetical protein
MKFPTAQLKYSSNPPTEVIRQCGLLASSSPIEGKRLPVDPDADIVVVLGKFDSCDSKLTLLALRYLHPKYNLFPQPMCNNQKLALFHDLKKLCPRGGFEARRFGGSSGLAKTSDELFEFLRVPANLPRKLVAAKILKCRGKYKIIYVPNVNQKKRAVSVTYSNPVYGGAFELKGKFIDKYKFLLTFAKLKAASAEILHDINNQRNMAREPLIQPEAIENERELFRGHLKASGTGKKSFHNALRMFAVDNKHTLIAHPVGYHLDVFKDDQPGLENKTAFRVTGYKGVGRGGGRKNEFVFALLDWGNTPQGRIRRRYIALGGDPAVRLTQTRLDQFDREGGMFANLRAAGAEEQADDTE